jgi:hypothetical protein
MSASDNFIKERVCSPTSSITVSTNCWMLHAQAVKFAVGDFFLEAMTEMVKREIL